MAAVPCSPLQIRNKGHFLKLGSEAVGELLGEELLWYHSISWCALWLYTSNNWERNRSRQSRKQIHNAVSIKAAIGPCGKLQSCFGLSKLSQIRQMDEDFVYLPQPVILPENNLVGGSSLRAAAKGWVQKH